MKRTIFGLATILVVLLAVLAVLVVHPSRKVKAHRGCSSRTLMGDYGWSEFGYDPEDSPTSFWTGAELVHFDGNESFSASETYYIENGVPDPNNGNGSVSGTYTVKSDCTVKLTYTLGGDTYSDHGVVVGANGSEVIADEYDETTSDITGHLDIKKIGDSD